jgi:hypothetical protein
MTPRQLRRGTEQACWQRSNVGYMKICKYETSDLKMSFILIWNFLAGYRYQSGLNGNPVEAMDACWQQWLYQQYWGFIFNIMARLS